MSENKNSPIVSLPTKGYTVDPTQNGGSFTIIDAPIINDGSIAIKNPSFEETVLADGDFTLVPPPGWEAYDPNDLVPANPTFESSVIVTFNPSKSYYPGEAPDGQNVGDVYIVQPPGSGVAGLSQTLDTVVQPNTRYTLVVDVGNAAGNFEGIDLTGFPGYALVLSAGDSILDYSVNPVAIPDGQFKTVALSYATQTEDALGENLKIRLLNLNSGPGAEVDFDRVQLIAEPAGKTNFVDIKNRGFDDIALADNGFTSEPPSGWSLYDPSGLFSNPNTDSIVGTFNPPKTNYFIETTGETFLGSERKNIGYVFLTEQPGSGVVGLSQTLDAKLTANTRYTLVADVGNPTGTDTAATGLDYAGFPGYRVELLAGDTVLAKDNNTLQIAEGNFATSRVDFIAGADNPLLGKNLQIRLTNLLNGKGLEVDFDSVGLFTEEVKNGSSIYIDNPGFEIPALADGDFTLTVPPGWNTFDPFGFIPQNPTSTSSSVGTFNPIKSNYPLEAPEGQNVGSVYLTQAPDTATVGLTQTLDTVVQANTQYTLSVDVGNTAGAFEGVDFTGFPGYRVALVAGDEIVAVDNNSLSIEDGKFATSNVSFTAATGESFVGKNLGIRLINALTGVGTEVDFDNVRLNAEVVSASAVTDNQTLYGSSGTTTINGGVGNDIIFGNGLSNTLFGRDGNDQLFGASTNDYIGGGTGNDLIFGNGGKDILLGDAGDDIIFGGSQSDIILGGIGNDTIYGNGGGDLIDGGAGNNTIFLGAGNAAIALNRGGFDTVNNFQLGSSRFFVGSLLNDLSFADSANGVQISAGKDLLAVVSGQSASTFSSNSSSIFKG